MRARQLGIAGTTVYKGILAYVAHASAGEQAPATPGVEQKP
jgi:PII-like signaling protein